MTIRALGVAAVFGLGVGIGCATAPLMVPKASAQQAGVTRWEYTCANSPGGDSLTGWANRYGSEGWELVTVEAHDNETDAYCFKRPKM